MGAGGSVPTQRQLQQWEGVVGELQQLVNLQRQHIDQGTAPSGGQLRTGARGSMPARSPRGVNINTDDTTSPRAGVAGLQTPRDDAVHTSDHPTDRAAAGRRSSILKSDAEVRRIDEKRRSLQKGADTGSDMGEVAALQTSVGRQSITVGRRSSSVCFTGGKPPAEIEAAVQSHSAKKGPNVVSPRTAGLPTGDVPGGRPSQQQGLVDVDGVLQGTTAADARRQNRQEMMRCRKFRKDFFDYYMTEECDPHTSIQCGYLGNICAALSYLLCSQGGGQLQPKNFVTVEDIFFTCHLPLHYVVNPSISLPELYDIAREFVEHDPRFRDAIRVEVCHMDPVLVDGEVEQGEYANDTGDRGPPSLAAFRKHIEEDMQGTHGITVYNFDPFIVEQSKLHVDDTDSEGDEEEQKETPGEQPVAPYDGNVTSGPGSATTDHAPSHTLPNQCLAVYKSQEKPKTKFQRRNRGWFSLGIEYNSAQHLMTLADAQIDTEVHLKQNEAPLTALYRACCARDRVNGRLRGFVRFSLVAKAAPLKEEEELESRELFVPDLYLGKGPHGIPLSSVDGHISLHIVAFAYAVHLIQGLTSDEAGQGVNCKDICNRMDFPLAAILNFPMSLVQAHAYFQAYLAKSGLSEKMYSVVQPIEKKVDTDDAPPTMSIMDFESVLIQVGERSLDSTQPNCVMVLSFDVGCAHNTLGLGTKESHYGVLMSYDQDKQMVAMLDVTPKKYSRMWFTSLMRLHKAVVGKGYILLYRRNQVDDDGAPMTDITVGRQDTAVRLKLSSATLPVQMSNEYIHAFEFPPRPMCVTPLAVAFNRLGKYCMVRDIVNYIDVDPSFIVSDHVAIRDVARIANNYLNKNNLVDSWSVEVQNFDTKRDGTPRVTLEAFEEKLKAVVADKDCVMIVQCSRAVLNAHGSGVGGEYCLIVEYNPDTQRVVVADVNPQIWFRHVALPLSWLYRGACEKDAVSIRERGWLIIRKGPTPPYLRYSRGRDINFLRVPSAQPFRLPQAVHLSAISFALSTLESPPCSPEEVFYTSFTCLSGERFRRGSAIFPWQQLKISLHDLKERMTVGAVATMCTKFEEARGHLLKGVTVVGQSREEFLVAVTESCKQEDPPYMLMVVYRSELVHDIKLDADSINWETGCGLIKYFDPETRMVTVADCCPTRYGDFWEVTLDTLYDAADLVSADKEDNGLVRIEKREPRSSADADRPQEAPVEFGQCAF
eukprot:TRINITY_DN1129_c0_g1_i1.p1 TRINITY_DN1129_c0_g1~~TRINITY_DN1129_c0_g1_i1.p1  ORF type:complete len:1217 (+),score=433.21 TRINITY_DN1129_c0_g1_i1:174-3824(+)